MNPKSLMFFLVAVYSAVLGFILSSLLAFWPAAAMISLLFGIFIATLETKYGPLLWLDILAMALGMLIGAIFLGSADIAFFNQYFNNMLITTIVNAGIIPAFFLLGVGVHDLWYWIKRVASKQTFLSI